MNIIEIYQAVQDKVREEQNGVLTIASFNIKLKSASIWLQDYLTGDIEGIKPPEPYTTQKLRDFLSILLTTTTGIVEGGLFAKPENYYMWDAFSIIGSWKDEECGEEVIRIGCDTPIEILDGDVFNSRCQTHIKSLQPSIKKPIAKIVGNSFQCLPEDLGSVKLTYKRYAIPGEVKVVYDPLYGQDVPDPVNSIDSEWPDYALNLLVWRISASYATANREDNLKQQLQVDGKSARG